jgi:hypothetical protein
MRFKLRRDNILKVIIKGLKVIRLVFAYFFFLVSLGFLLVEKEVSSFIIIFIISSLFFIPEIKKVVRWLGKYECIKCNKKIGVGNWFKYGSKCKNCYDKEQRDKKEIEEKKQRMEKEIREREQKAKEEEQEKINRKKEEEFGGVKNKLDELEKYLDQTQNYKIQVSNNYDLEYWGNFGEITCIMKKEELIKIIKKSKLDIPQLATYLQEKMEVINEAIKITGEESERQHKLKIREQAEKLVYGESKGKKKREAIKESDKELIFKKFGNKCSVCGREEGLHIHHKDKDPKNNRMNNLIVLCGVCHKKIHMKVR